MRFLHHREAGLPKESYFTTREVDFLRTLASVSFPTHTAWATLNYPGSQTLPLHIVALPYPLPVEFLPKINFLHDQMLQDKVQHGYIDPNVTYEHRQAHLWMVTMQEDVHLPVGQTLFLADSIRTEGNQPPPADPEPSPPGLRLKIEPKPIQEKKRELAVFDESRVARWWLFHTWIKPQYRDHKIFKSSVDYFRKWHPGFVLRERQPSLINALKMHPEHLP
ncbi:MAG: hypothetical protein WCH43_14585, partial [Verrucomicrobiota bacterium]